jgi:hypothetical protein
MVSYQIVCIIKPDVNSPSEYITQIGYEDEGTVYLIPISTVIKRIEKNSKEFYVKADGEIVYVTIDERNGRKFIKTTSEDTRKRQFIKALVNSILPENKDESLVQSMFLV